MRRPPASCSGDLARAHSFSSWVVTSVIDLFGRTRPGLFLSSFFVPRTVPAIGADAIFSLGQQPELFLSFRYLRSTLLFAKKLLFSHPRRQIQSSLLLRQILTSPSGWLLQHSLPSSRFPIPRSLAQVLGASLGHSRRLLLNIHFSPAPGDWRRHNIITSFIFAPLVAIVA